MTSLAVAEPTKDDAYAMFDAITAGQDPVVFARDVLGVDLNPAQIRWFRTIFPEGSDIETWRYRKVVHVSSNQLGKAQPVDEPVLTPTGWRPIGSLGIGDEVFAGDGTVTRVTGVFPQGVKSVFRLTFDDGSQTRSCDEHLWRVRTPETRWGKRDARDTWVVKSLAELRASYGDSPSPTKRWSIPAPGPVEYAHRPVPIDPYALGVLIGDGCIRYGVEFTTADPEIADSIRSVVPAPLEVRHSGKYTYRVSTPLGKRNAWMDALRDLGLFGKLSADKFVPDLYLHNSVDVRLAILQGLMDTDGACEKGGTVNFCSISPQLASDVADLARSLGGKARVTQRRTQYTHNGERRTGQVAYMVRIKPPELPMFRLDRKQCRVPNPQTRTRDRIIYNIEPAGEAESVCIRVAHQDHTYITRDYIVTHNSLGLAILILWALLHKVGRPRNDPMKWWSQPYQWFHVSPQQGQSYIPFQDMLLLIRGDHRAQRRKPSPLLEAFFHEVNVEVYYKGIATEHGAICQFRTTGDKADALQGKRADGISFDEAAFEDHLIEVVNTVLMMRLISTGGPLLIISTPNGVNDYYTLVHEITGSGHHPDGTVHMRFDSDCPAVIAGGECPMVWESGENAVVWSTIQDNVGYGITQEAVDEMEQSLGEKKEQQLRGAFLEPESAFFVPTKKVYDAFKPSMPDSQPPVAGHRYIVFWDIAFATAGDSQVGIVIDVTKKPWKAVYMRYFKKPVHSDQLQLEMRSLHLMYSMEGQAHILTTFDKSGAVGHAWGQQIANIRPSAGLTFKASNKVDILTNLRDVLTSNNLHIPASWTVVRNEVLNYRLKDDKIKQDTVMALAGAAWFAARGALGAVAKKPFQVHGRASWFVK